MSPHRVQAKFVLDLPEGFMSDRVVPVFHRWIPSDRTGELLLDVADYRHVHAGPGIVLVGHEADYVFERIDGWFGFRYVRKRNVPPSLPAALALAIRGAVRGARLLLEDLAQPLAAADLSWVELTIVDPLRYPNDGSGFSSVAGAVTALLGFSGLMRGVPERVSMDPREPLRVRVPLGETGRLDVLEALHAPAEDGHALA
jgi:hypothetical protein